jgi:hypothetical protein
LQKVQSTKSIRDIANVWNAEVRLLARIGRHTFLDANPIHCNPSYVVETDWQR